MAKAETRRFLLLTCAGHALKEPTLPAAAFADLPARKILTLNMDVPEPWLVEPTQARFMWQGADAVISGM